MLPRSSFHLQLAQTWSYYFSNNFCKQRLFLCPSNLLLSVHSEENQSTSTESANDVTAERHILPKGFMKISKCFIENTTSI